MVWRGESRVEIANVMERPAGHDRVVGLIGLLEILQQQGAEERTRWRRGINAEDLVPGDRQRRRQHPLSAAHLEQPRGRFGQLGPEKLLERDQPSGPS